MTGPGWTTDREYRAGDRVLLHARCGPSGSRLVNGTTATVTHVDATGLTVRSTETARRACCRPVRAGHPQGRLAERVPRLGPHRRRGPGRHLGGLPPAGQLGARRLPGLYRPVPLPPAHPHLEHHPRGGGRSRRDRSPTSATPPRRSPTRLAANPTPPWRHAATPGPSTASCESGSPSTSRCWPAGRPTARDDLAAAVKELQTGAGLAGQHGRHRGGAAQRLNAIGPLARLSRQGHQERRGLEDKLAADLEQAARARDQYDELAGVVARLRRAQDTLSPFRHGGRLARRRGPKAPRRA